MDVSAPTSMKNAANCDMVVWIAEPVNHRIFERKWRSRAILRACLFECPQKCDICSISLGVCFFHFWGWSCWWARAIRRKVRWSPCFDSFILSELCTVARSWERILFHDFLYFWLFCVSNGGCGLVCDTGGNLPRIFQTVTHALWSNLLPGSRVLQTQVFAEWLKESRENKKSPSWGKAHLIHGKCWKRRYRRKEKVILYRALTLK